MNYQGVFGNINIEPYKEAAARFLPDKIKVIFIFESPPFPPPIHPITGVKNPDWSYFYRFKTKGSNNLRREVCSAVFNKKMEDHEDFLYKFCAEGYFLIDSVNYPINKIIEENKHQVKLTRKGDVDNKEREKVIYSEANNLIRTIEYWVKKSSSKTNGIKMLLVKVSVFNGLMIYNNNFKQKVVDQKYNVLNTETIPFPMVPNNKKFITDVRKLLKLV